MKRFLIVELVSFAVVNFVKRTWEKILVIDLDPQANLTRCFGVESTNDRTKTIGHLLMTELDSKNQKKSKLKAIGKRNSAYYV